MEQNDETEFFPENSVSFSHNSVACAVRTLQFVLFKQALRENPINLPNGEYFLYRSKVVGTL